jgi:hypothetical protein
MLADLRFQGCCPVMVRGYAGGMTAKGGGSQPRDGQGLADTITTSTGVAVMAYVRDTSSSASRARASRILTDVTWNATLLEMGHCRATAQAGRRWRSPC